MKNQFIKSWKRVQQNSQVLPVFLVLRYALPQAVNSAQLITKAHSFSQENKPKGKETKTNLQSMGNMDGLCCWDKALSLLRLKSSWESNKMNLQMVKKTIAPTAVYLTAPLLVVGVLRIEVAPIISHDVSCVLQDPTGNYSMLNIFYYYFCLK